MIGLLCSYAITVRQQSVNFGVKIRKQVYALARRNQKFSHGFTRIARDQLKTNREDPRKPVDAFIPSTKAAPRHSYARKRSAAPYVHWHE